MGVRVGVAMWALKWACKLYDFLKFLGGLMGVRVGVAKGV